MGIGKKIGLLIVFWAVASNSFAGVYGKYVDEEQNRIDMFDGIMDGQLKLASKPLSDRATRLFFTDIDSLQRYTSAKPYAKNNPHAEFNLSKVLEHVQKYNVENLTYFEKILRLTKKVVYKTNRVEDMLRADVKHALPVFPFIVKKKYAKYFLQTAAKYIPYDVLRMYKEYQWEPYKMEVLRAVAESDPKSITQYMFSSHNMGKSLRETDDEVILLIKKIYKTQGNAAKSYTNLHQIYNGVWTINQSENIAKDKKNYFKHLIQLRTNQNIMASYSVDKTLEQLALKSVRRMNELHDVPSENVRFALGNKMTASEIYTCMVYTSEEMFTSTFLGLYKRFMRKLPTQSGYVFLEQMGFNRFRQFIKSCAGFNTLQPFLKTMTDNEVMLLIDKLVNGLGEFGGNLEAAVQVADIIGGIDDNRLKNLFGEALKREIMLADSQSQKEKILMYGILYQLWGAEFSSLDIKNSIDLQMPDLTVINADLLFKNGKHIQQHLFFDDDDGKASYATFMSTFRRRGWTVVNKNGYVIIKSTTGKNIEIFANKPKAEYTAQPFLKKYFNTIERWPDLVVHRGHSYYISSTIKNIYPQTKVCIMGSCGGYHQIVNAMERSEDISIISSKQIGTMAVNNVLIFTICEEIRLGNDLNWPVIWAKLTHKLGANSKFKEYIPPHKNLGATFIRAYSDMLKGI